MWTHLRGALSANYLRGEERDAGVGASLHIVTPAMAGSQAWGRVVFGVIDSRDALGRDALM